MAGGVVERRKEPAGHGRLSRMGQWWRRALGSEGYERHTVLLIGKSTVAATLAWIISFSLLNAQSPAFAPFSAVLIMQVTVYQSLLQSSRYVAAVAAGAALLAGSACTRFGVFAAGIASAEYPAYTVVPQRAALRRKSGV